MAGTVNCLEVLGLDAGGLRVLREWAAERAVTLRFKAEERCVFDRMAKREVESTVAHVREYSGGLKITDKASKKARAVKQSGRGGGGCVLWWLTRERAGGDDGDGVLLEL